MSKRTDREIIEQLMKVGASEENAREIHAIGSGRSHGDVVFRDKNGRELPPSEWPPEFRPDPNNIGFSIPRRPEPPDDDESPSAA